jgi:plastocyanin
MAQKTINITNCGASPNPLHVDVGDQVQFCTADTRSYQVTGLGHVFQGSPGRIPVPASECSDYYTVTGAKGRYPYNIEPDCPPEGPPEIIIDN